MAALTPARWDRSRQGRDRKENRYTALENTSTTTDSTSRPAPLITLAESPFNAEGSPGSLGDHALLLTPEEAARRLSVGRTTIYALMASGDLSSVNIGRCRRVPVSSLRSFVLRLVNESSAEQRPW